MGGSGGLLGQEGRKGHDEVKDIFITTMIAGLSGCTVLRAELDLQCVVGSYGGVLACESSVYVTGVAAGGEATGAVCSVLCCGKSRDNADLKLLFNQELSTGPILMGA